MIHLFFFLPDTMWLQFLCYLISLVDEVVLTSFFPSCLVFLLCSPLWRRADLTPRNHPLSRLPGALRQQPELRVEGLRPRGSRDTGTWDVTAE